MFTIIFFFLLAVIAAGACAVLLNQKAVGALAGLLIFMFGIAYSAITVVPAGHRGVQVTMGTVNPTALESGWQFVNPISSVKDVNIQIQRTTMEGAAAGTKDLQQVHTDITVNYRLSPEKVALIYRDFGLNIVDKVLAPALNEAFKSVTGHYTSEELITKRDEVSQAILQQVRTKVAQFDINIDNVSLVNFGFSAEYQKAIEQKVIATQQKQKAEMDLQRIKVEAASRIAQAEGEAKAIAIQAQAIQTNGGANYVQLQWIEKWDGKLPDTVVNGSGSGLMLNVGK
jgi:regulator of protease activity HflC (stomatin/prohibitin superfamily)